LFAADRKTAPGGPGRGDQADLAPHVVPGGHDVPHHGADGAGGADDGQGRSVAHRPVPPYTTACSSPPSSNASWVALTATLTSFSSTTTEIRISDVEIISMLTPASASAPKNVALTPGLDRMPAPTREILPIRSSYRSESKPTS